MLDAAVDDVRDHDYIANPTVIDLLRALPRSLNSSARVTLVAFWQDAGRMSGPTEMTLDEIRACTGLSIASQRKAIRTLEQAGFLTPNERIRFATGPRWLRVVRSPLIISPEGGR